MKNRGKFGEFEELGVRGKFGEFEEIGVRSQELEKTLFFLGGWVRAKSEAFLLEVRGQKKQSFFQREHCCALWSALELMCRKVYIYVIITYRYITRRYYVSTKIPITLADFEYCDYGRECFEKYA